jgi:hypothetical protein
MGGMLVREVSAMVSRVGLTLTPGSGSAVMMSTMAFGGVR